MEDNKLLELRKKIDAIDAEMLELLKRRSEIVLQVGKHKGENGGNNLIRSGREARMLRELTTRGAGEFPKEAVRALWRGIISASLRIECGLKIAIPTGADLELHKTVIEYFGAFSDYKECDGDNEVLKAIDKHTVGIFTLDTGWWLELAKHKNLKVFAKLSEGIFAVAKLETEESGDDKTLAITETDAHKGHKLAEHGKVKLVELNGYLKEVPNAVVIGHYGL